MAIKPMLDDLELQLVQQIEADERQVRAQHAVPALEGDFLQPLGRRAERITLNGILTEDDDKAVGEKLKGLREKFRAARPVPFAADIATATKIDTVLIEEMSVRELAGKPERFEYAFALREYIPAPPPEEEKPPPPTPPLVTELIVKVIVQGQPSFDFSKVRVTVSGQQDDGTAVNDLPLTNRANDTWTETDFPPGNYTVTATVSDPPMSNSETAHVLEHQKTEVTIVLQPGSIGGVAVAYVIHYWFDKAFIEPCLRPVLREVAQRAGRGGEKLLIVGHTDLVGNDDYNQALSERRARGVYAYLTFGNDANASVAEWNELRKTRLTGQTVSLNDTWGVREYQYMLQDLGWYVGPINETNDDNTRAAVRAFQAAKGLTVDGIVGDQTWPVLIRDYLAQDNLSVDESRFFHVTKDGCDSGALKWLGCGEKDPVLNTQNAWRPNRRTEMLFINATSLPPCEVPRPVTYDIRPDGSDPGQWCLGPGNRSQPCCFLTRESEQPDKFLVQPAETRTITVSGRITFDDGAPLANARYVLIAPDGEYMDGERPSGSDRGRPVPARTDANGNFSYPDKPKVAGIYILELQEPFVVRVEGEPAEGAKGNIACKQLDGSSNLNIIVSREGCLLLSRVHFEFDKSFVRPAAKRTLRALADFVQRTPPGRQLLPIGHTDLRGRAAYNDELGIRRAKAVYGFLTGNPPDPDNPARSIWLNLFHDGRENWGASEIQYMLLDLGFYCHHLTNVIDAETNRAVQSFKNRFGLGNNAIVDDVFLDRLFGEYIAHDGAPVPANRFLTPPRWLSCGENHPIDLRGGAPFGGRSEKDRRVEFVIFPQPPRPAPASTTDCARYLNWNMPCEPRWLEFIGPKRNAIDPADAEEILAFLEVSNWENAFDFDPPDANGHIHPTGDRPRVDFIDRDPDRFFVQLTDLNVRGAGIIRARIKSINDAGGDVNPFVEFELREDANDPGTFRSNSMLLVSDEIDNGEINNGSAAGAAPFRARGIANGALNDPLLRVEIGGHVIVDYDGAELGRIPVYDPDCIKSIAVNIIILRKIDGSACTSEPDVQERVRRLQQCYQQSGIRFDVTIRTARVDEMPPGVLLSDVSGITVNPGALVDRGSLDPEERALIESPLNIRTAAGGGRTDVIQVFYANQIDGTAATAIAYPRVTYTSPAPGDDIFNLLIIGADNDENSTLPHELLHDLLNSFHDATSNTRTNLFFESALGQPDFTDTTVTSKKRILEVQVERILSNVSGVIP